jgi:glucose-1-phosphate thymidylyltransferase
MKGIVLAGGSGSRLLPMTKVTNKHLLPVYNKPMIFFPLDTLKAGGLEECIIITGIDHVDHFSRLLGKEYKGMKLRYAVQDEAGGIAQALSLADRYVNNDNAAVILGDNVFQYGLYFSDFKSGARIHLKKVPDPERFGVAILINNKVVDIKEKPKKLVSDFAVTGLYLYDSTVFDKIRKLKPSKRNELEITDVNNLYLKGGSLDYRVINGYWSDAGTVESLYRASSFVRNNKKER